MTKQYGILLAAMMMVFAVSASSFAAETTVTTEAGSSWNLVDHLSVSYFGNFHGGTLNDLGSPYTVDHAGKISKTSAVNFDSELNAAYMFDSSVGVGPVVPFFFMPVMGQGVSLGDVGVKAFNKKAYSSENLNVYANIIFQLPTSDGSKARDMDFAIKTTPNVRYSFAGTRWTTGAWTEAKAYLGVSSGKTFKLFGAPYVNYQILPTLSANLLYEMEAQHVKNDSSALNFTNVQTDLCPGVIWNITPHVLVNPYVQLFTGNTVSWDRAAVGAVISATLL